MSLLYFIFIRACLFKSLMLISQNFSNPRSLFTKVSLFNSLKKHFLQYSFEKLLYDLQFIILGLIFLKFYLIIVKVVKWKSDSPVSVTNVPWKLRGILVEIKSIHAGFQSSYNMWVALLGFLGSSYRKMIACAVYQFRYWNLLKVLFYRMLCVVHQFQYWNLLQVLFCRFQYWNLLKVLFYRM